MLNSINMENIFFESKVMWSQIDSNNHLRHSAYADFGAQARLEVLSKFGFDSVLLKKLNMGPIIFREELIYLREVSPADTVKVSCEMSHCRRDGSRWSFTQTIYKGDGVKAALINVEGAWMDIEKRKLTALPPEWALALMDIPKSIDFILEEVPEKKPDPIK
jgi:acyl-CoA thioester hydrolase